MNKAQHLYTYQEYRDLREPKTLDDGTVLHEEYKRYVYIRRATMPLPDKSKFSKILNGLFQKKS